MLQRYYRALRAASPVVLSLLRIVTALVLMEHGTQKLFDFPPMPRFGGIPGAAAAQPAGGAPAILQAQRANAGAPAATGTAPGAGVAATPPAAGAAPGPAATPDATTTVAQAAPAAGAAPAGRGGPAGGGRAGGPGGGGPGGGFRGPPPYLFPIAGWIETFGGALMVVGLFSRSVAFLLSGETAVIYFIAHAPTGFFPATNGGEPVVLFSWVFIYIFFAGPGLISLDALWRRLRGRSARTGRPLPAEA